MDSGAALFICIAIFLTGSKWENQAEAAEGLRIVFLLCLFNIPNLIMSSYFPARTLHHKNICFKLMFSYRTLFHTASTTKLTLDELGAVNLNLVDLDTILFAWPSAQRGVSIKFFHGI